MKIKFGPVTSSEIEVMLEAAGSDGNKLANQILDARHGNTWVLTDEEAQYLGNEMMGDADRVAEAIGDAAGRAFERGGQKILDTLKHSTK